LKVFLIDGGFGMATESHRSFIVTLSIIGDESCVACISVFSAVWLTATDPDESAT